MKRVLSVVLALILILTTFAACGKKKSDGTDMKAGGSGSDSSSVKIDSTNPSVNDSTDDSPGDIESPGNNPSQTDDTPVSANVGVGEYITFGSYEQDHDESNGKEPIEWLVLNRDGSKALVISKYGLDAKWYYRVDVSGIWEISDLRAWLNDTFYNNAFDSVKQSQIITTAVKNDDNPDYGTDGGNDTNDKVFLLSIDEVNKYFSSDEARKCVPTAYAKAQGASTSAGFVTANGEATCKWWLRSSGSFSGRVATVIGDGYVDTDGYNLTCGSCAVRPAMWITVGT